MRSRGTSEKGVIRMAENKNIVALIPAYQPTMTLPELVWELQCSGAAVVVVDDGSGLDFAPVFEKVAQSAVVLHHGCNRGKGRAIKTALTYIRQNFSDGCIVVTLDADGQHSPEDTIAVACAAAEQPDALTLGSRGFDGAVPTRSRFGNTVTRFVYHAAAGVAVYDTQTGLRAFGAMLIPLMLEIKGERYEYEMNMLLECARKDVAIREVQISTIYHDNNSGSHFRAVRDSLRVYTGIARFAASSFISFLVDYGLYGLLTVLTARLGEASVPLSNILARVVSAGLNFTINRRYVFKSCNSAAKTGLQYFVLAACILAGNTVLLSALTELVGLNRYAAKLLTELTFFILSYLIQQKVIFRKRNPEDRR